MFGQFTLDGTFQTILFIVLLLLIGGYAYIEIARLKKRVEELSQEVKQCTVSASFSSLDIPVKTTTDPDIENPKIVSYSPESAPVETNEISQKISDTDLFSFMKIPVSEQPIQETSANDISVIEQPVTEQPVTEQPVTEQPVTEQPVTEPPVTDSVSQPEHEPKSSETPDDTIKIITSHASNIYETKTVSELKEILQEKGLPLSGNKTKLIKRIMEHEQSQK